MNQANPTLKALILDFGGVITRTLFETHRETEQALGLAPNALQWQGPFDVQNDSLWQDMIGDKITERDYWHHRAKETGELVGKNWPTMKDFVIAARGDVDPVEIIRPEFLHTLSIVKSAGRRVSILSNELDLFYGAEFRKKLSFLQDFDSIIDATYTKILKPDSRSYELVTQSLDLNPAQCLFIDDQLRNIQGAEKFGMQTVHFDVVNPQSSYNEALTKLGLTQ